MERSAGLSSVLDASAVIALFEEEPGADRVESEIEHGSLASWVNLGEVLYVEARRIGLEEARAGVLRLVERIVAEEPDAELVQAAATVKFENRLSYADAYAVATAERHRLPLLTGDPEILEAGRPGLEVIDLGKDA